MYRLVYAYVFSSIIKEAVMFVQITLECVVKFVLPLDNSFAGRLPYFWIICTCVVFSIIQADVFLNYMYMCGISIVKADILINIFS